ncbi:MAG TPA: UDP-N-acetylmuramoyl-tripeptide--D-alanyl-D-alanine ligase [Patescibacteria group bacterium]|nr:UDP-N-acetylmuramoyl-tripeptide--D-alanyl-D-alanine ligase [Patescibacteria group bacterium]
MIPPLTSQLAVLQQSEYEWDKFMEWKAAHKNDKAVVEPKAWTIKLKFLKLWSVLFPLRAGVLLIAIPQALFQNIVILLASIKLRVLQKRGLRVIAIAGSYAKTSTKNILAHILKPQYAVRVTPGNINTLFGIAREILSLSSRDQIFIAELGEYNPGDLAKFVRLLSPQYKILTNIGVAHLERFKTKTALEAEFHSFAAESTANYQMSNVHVSRSGTEADVDIDGEEVHVFVPLLGKHNIENAASCMKLATKFGITLAQSATALQSLPYVQYRMEPMLLENNVLVINNGYNSNPDSAQRALEVLHEIDGTQKVIITPGFVELGSISQEANTEFGKQIAKVADIVVLMRGANQDDIRLGLNQTHFKNTNVYEADTESEAMEKIKEKIKPGAVILFENSLMEIYKIN